MALRVAWDSRTMYRQPGRGIGNYSWNLLAALNRLPEPPEVLLFRSAEDARPDGRPSGIQLRPTWGYRWQIWERVSLPAAASLSGSHMLHSLANTCPPFAALPRVVTLHDVIPFLPELNEPGSLLPYFRKTIPRALASATRIITDSQCSARDIRRILGVPAARLDVIPLAVSDDLAVPGDREVDDILCRLDIAGPYLLALAAAAPRKNTHGVLKAFARARRSATDLTLVLTGVTPALAVEIRQRQRHLGVPETAVRLLNFVDNRALAALYARADAFLYLSLYEGFGLPILEAMRCGTLVVCSNRGSCAEVAGDAALLADPEAIEEVAATLIGALRMSSAERGRWIAAGRAREQQFTWAATAAATLDVYRRTLGQRVH
jgi:glycosyltransferase involved in cell wall biosynthesis